MSKTMTLDAMMHDDGINAHSSRPPDLYGIAIAKDWFARGEWPDGRSTEDVLAQKTAGTPVFFSDDILPFGAEADEEDDCIHEDYEIDILTGRATCDGCGETWTATDAQMQRHEELSQQEYDPIGDAVDRARDRDEERRAFGEDDEND